MSVHKVKRAGRKDGWKVRYRDHTKDGKACSDTFDHKPDADARDAKIRQAKQRGEPIPQLGRGNGGETFKDFTLNVWWPNYAEARCTAKTRAGYAGLLDRHVIPYIGSDSLAYIDVARIFEVAAAIKANAPGYSAARSLKLVRQILAFALQTGHIQGFNPADVLRARGTLPSQQRIGDPYALDPVEVEGIRTALLARRTPHGLRDATLVSLMAYAGLRPEEALALQWEHIEPGSIRVRQANVNGQFGPTKTGKSRTVRPLIAPLVSDLKLWRKASGDPSRSALLFPDSNGELWPEATYANWRGRVFNPRAPKDATPYSCRHGFASLLIREGKTLADVAKLMGNSPKQTADAYTHAFERYEGLPSEPMESLVTAARSVQKVSAPSAVVA